MYDSTGFRIFVFAIVIFSMIVSLEATHSLLTSESKTLEGNIEKIVVNDDGTYDIIMDDYHRYVIRFDDDVNNVNLKNQSQIIIRMNNMARWFVKDDVWLVTEVVIVDDTQIN